MVTDWDDTMFSTRFGLFMFLLCFCNNIQVKETLSVENRTSVAMAGETLHYNILLNAPANSSDPLRCFQDGHEVWKQVITSRSATTLNMRANFTMKNSSDSGDYYCRYRDKTLHWVVLVRDVGYCEPDKDLENDIIALLVLNTLLLLFSVFGSVYVFKWHKDHPSSEEGGNGTQESKRESNTGMRNEASTSDSVYMALEPRPVSIYDVLNVDEARRENTERRSSKETAKISQTEEGNFESVYENL